MKKFSIAAVLAAAVMFAVPMNAAEAGGSKHGWHKKDCLFGWLMHDRGDKKVAKKKKKGKKKHAKKSKKKAMRA